MRSNIADDSVYGSLLGMNGDALGASDGGIDSAQAADVNVTVGINVIDGHGNFVGMPGEHDPRRTTFVESCDRVAVGIGVSFIGKLLDIIKPDALSASFVSGRAGGVEQGLQEL